MKKIRKTLHSILHTFTEYSVDTLHFFPICKVTIAKMQQNLSSHKRTNLPLGGRETNNIVDFLLGRGHTCNIHMAYRRQKKANM